MELGLDLFRIAALECHDSAASFALAWSEGFHAGRIAAFEDPTRQVAQPVLDVRDPDLEDQVQRRQPGVVRRYRPGASLQAPRVVREVELLQGKGERLSRGKPAG